MRSGNVKGRNIIYCPGEYAKQPFLVVMIGIHRDMVVQYIKVYDFMYFKNNWSFSCMKC